MSLLRFFFYLAEGEMSAKNVLRYLLVAVAAVGLLLALGLMHRPTVPARADHIFRLQAPPFARAASAEAVEVASVIEDEAGISAWFQASSSINLNSVREVFRTIEAETTDYIIGSVPVPNYTEEWDVHVYVHRDGWILAYYLAADPVGKIYDWKAYHNSGRTTLSTKLENVVAVVANVAGVPFSSANVTYYDFRYPNATHLMLIAEWGDWYRDSFQVRLPGSFTYYERSWSLANTTVYGIYWLNGVEIKNISFGDWQMAHGTFSATQLPPEQYHTIEVTESDYAGLTLVYRVP
jgi:hypothetical protein